MELSEKSVLRLFAHFIWSLIRLLHVLPTHHFPVDGVRPRLLAGVHGPVVVERHEAEAARSVNFLFVPIRSSPSP